MENNYNRKKKNNGFFLFFSFCFFLALQLKNALYSRDEQVKKTYQERWLAIPENIRLHIKTNVNIIQ